jgi:hypothetical protein
MSNERIEQFEKAFASDGGLCRATCHCGKTYYNSYDQQIGWEEGELEKLEADDQAIGVDFHVGRVDLEGREYVNTCTCWHERAEIVMNFLDSHAFQIAEYLTLEKARKQKEADRSPVVK